MLKRLIILFLIFPFLTQILSAQSDSIKRSSLLYLYLKPGAGITFIGGNITKTDYNNPKAGFASNFGPAYSLEALLLVNRRFGISCTAAYSQYSLHKVLNLAEAYKKDLSTDNLTFSYNNYVFYHILAGPHYYLNLSHVYALDFHAKAGLVIGQSPEIKLEYGANPVNTTIQKGATGYGFAFNAGMGYTRPLYQDYVDLHINANFFLSQPVFHIQNENMNDKISRRLDKYNEAIYGVILAVGVGARVW